MHGVGDQGSGGMESGIVGAVIDALGFPAAVVDASKKVLHGNRPFAEFMATGAGERLWRRLQVESVSAADARFVTDDGDGTTGPYIIGLRLLGGCNRKAYLVTVSAADRSDQDDAEIPTLHGDFTAAERAVLFALLAGRPLSEVAGARGTKVSTVRWHLKNLQAKLGATDKAEVVAWIARSPVCWLARTRDPRSDA